MYFPPQWQQDALNNLGIFLKHPLWSKLLPWRLRVLRWKFYETLYVAVWTRKTSR